MDRGNIGFIVLSSINALAILIAFMLYKGKQYAKEDAAQKKRDFKKNFLKVKSSKKRDI